MNECAEPLNSLWVNLTYLEYEEECSLSLLILIAKALCHKHKMPLLRKPDTWFMGKPIYYPCKIDWEKMERIIKDTKDNRLLVF